MARKKEMLGEKKVLFSNASHSINDYFQFRADKTNYVKKKDIARATPLSNRILAQRQLGQTINSLLKNRNNETRWEKDFATQCNISKVKQAELRHFFIRFDGFIKENCEKRERAEMKIGMERAAQEKLVNAISEIKSKIAKYNAIEIDLNKNVREYQLYKDFLLAAASRADNFSDIKQIINRHAILSGTRHSLGVEQATALEKVEQSRQKLTSSAGLHSHSKMILHTELAALRDRQVTATALASKWNSVLTCVKVFAAEKAIQVQQVENSCWDLYKTICLLQKEAIFYCQDDTANQLDFITERIKRVKDIYEMVENKRGKIEPLSNVPTVAISKNKH